jgi:ribonuclease G
MKGRLIVLDHHKGQQMAALMVDGRLNDLWFETDAPRPGTIYRAIADRPVKGLGGMFVKTPDGSGFLRHVKGLSAGQPILVQLTSFAEPGKALPLTQKILFKSRYAIVTPDAPGLNISRNIHDEERRAVLLQIAHGEMGQSDMGLILRSACATASTKEIAEDINAMADLATQIMAEQTGRAVTLVDGDGPHALAWREWSDPAIVETEPDGLERHGVLEVCEGLQTPFAALSEAGHCYIETTRAFVAVDVNTGTDSSPAAGLKTNLAAARELPRQLRLRGLGGQIVIDPAPMAKKDRRQFETAMRNAFRACQVDTNLVGWTTLGHFELQRQRARAALEIDLT